MLQVEEALQAILEDIRALPPESVHLADSLGRTLAEDYFAQTDLPPFDNSSMDGYAVVAAECATASAKSPVSAVVIGESAAGSATTIQPSAFTAIRIFTGAPIPPGYTAVIPQENVTVATDRSAIVIQTQVSEGAYIRRKASDVAAGTLIAPKGAVITPFLLLALAAHGNAMIQVTRKPAVAIIATGSELVEPGQPLQFGQIYNSNAYMLAAMAQSAGAEATILPIAQDNEEDILRRLEEAQRYDLIISSGGVSVGDHDLIKSAIEKMGQLKLWRVNMKPGKPVAFGKIGATPIIGLPGNPVSSAVTCLLFAAPAIHKMLGCSEASQEIFSAHITETIAQSDRRSYIRCALTHIDGEAHVTPLGLQDSHRTMSIAFMDVLAIIPEGSGVFPTGTLVQVIRAR